MLQKALALALELESFRITSRQRYRVTRNVTADSANDEYLYVVSNASSKLTEDGNGKLQSSKRDGDCE